MYLFFSSSAFLQESLQPDPGLIYAPADGKVVVIEETLENEYFKDMRLQISILCHRLTCTATGIRFPARSNMSVIIRGIIKWHGILNLPN